MELYGTSSGSKNLEDRKGLCVWMSLGMGAGTHPQYEFDTCWILNPTIY